MYSSKTLYGTIVNRCAQRWHMYEQVGTVARSQDRYLDMTKERQAHCGKEPYPSHSSCHSFLGGLIRSLSQAPWNTPILLNTQQECLSVLF